MYVNKDSFNSGTTQWRGYLAEFARKFSIDVSANFPIDDMYGDIMKTEWFGQVARKEPKEPGFRKKDLDALMRQILFRGHRIDPLLTVGDVKFKTSLGGRSKSLVLKATIKTVRGASTMPAILKLSNREIARQEQRNYDQFVKWHLSHLYRVDSLGYGETRNWGLVAYSFAFGDASEPEPVTSYIESCQFAKVRSMIPRIFSLEERKWYASDVVEDEADLEAYYNKRLFFFEDAFDLSRQVFDDLLPKIFHGRPQSSGTQTVIGDEVYPGRSRLRSMAPRRYKTCVCHGDLNSNNVLVAKGNGDEERFLFIDFQDTGRGHVFHDFVTFESSIRLYYGKDAVEGSGELYVPHTAAYDKRALMPSEYTHWEVKLAELGPGEILNNGPDIFVLMSEVRQCAYRNFPTESWATYLYAVAAYSFRILRVTKEPLGDGPKGRALAAVLASLGRLETNPG